MFPWSSNYLIISLHVQHKHKLLDMESKTRRSLERSPISAAANSRPLRRVESGSSSKSPSKPSYLHSPSVKAKVGGGGGLFSPKTAWKKSRWTSSSCRLSVDVADYWHGGVESSGNSRNSR